MASIEQDLPLSPFDESDERAPGAFFLTARDLAGLRNLVEGRRAYAEDDDTDGAAGTRDLLGTGNNHAHPDRGSAEQPFIRLTEAHYGAPEAATGNRALNPLYDGLDARAISNILGHQEAGLPKAGKDANIFFMAFGQYFDHGLDFLPKGGNGTIQIGGPGSGRAPGTDNPADLTRGTVSGTDAEGVPQHLNMTSPYVDQNQAYGSTALVGQFLRESDGARGFGAKLLAGGIDPSDPGFRLLPTLRELIEHRWNADTLFRAESLPGGAMSFRDYYSAYALPSGATGSLFDEATGAFDPDVLNGLVSNFMGSGHPLLLDTNPYMNLLDHYVAGDGRANENVSLTAMHTIWARNHNFHVETLEAAGFAGSPEAVFEAAKMINEAEYQRVVFDEFADMLIGGIRGTGSHGHAGYNPEAEASISHEFAAAVYRVGHSLIGQTLTILNPDGTTRDVPLFDAFLNPTNDPGAFAVPLPRGYVPQPGFEQIGAGAVLGGIVGQAAEEVDFNIVDAVRNDLVRINADLFAFNVARGRDVGLGSLNQVRMDLAGSQDPYVKEAVDFAGRANLTPYASWEDFQDRNGLSDAVIAQFRQAYPDLVLREPAALAAFEAANPDIALHDGPDGAKVVKGIDRVDLWVGGLAEKHVNDGLVGETFWVVLHEQFDRLQEADRFYYLDRFDNFDFYEDFVDGQNFSDIVARNTSLRNLPEHIFRSADGEDDIHIGAPGDGDPHAGQPQMHHRGHFGEVSHKVHSAAGEVHLLYDAVLDRDGDVGGQQAWTQARKDGMSLRDMAEGFLKSEEGRGHHGMDDDRAFVEGLYRTALGREGEAGGVAHWTDAIEDGMSRAEVVLGFAFSQENLQDLRIEFEHGVFTADADASDAARLYHGLLDRAPDARGLDAWTGAMKAGLSDLAAAQGFLDSAEYKARYANLSDEDFVDCLYENALGRHAEEAGLASWMRALEDGASRAAVAVGIALSPEAENHMMPRIEEGWHLA